MCTRDSAATIGINDFFLLFKKKMTYAVSVWRSARLLQNSAIGMKVLEDFSSLNNGGIPVIDTSV